MGFCLLNNVAVTAAALRARGARVAVVDYDAHHGNGTQDIFWADPDVLYVSLHEWPLYPGSGRLDEIGGARRRRSNVQRAAPGRGDGRRVPACVRRGDRARWPSDSPPTGCSCRPGSTRTGPIRSPASRCRRATTPCSRPVPSALAPGPGRTIVFLEGGYDLEAIRDCVAATLPVLVGEAPSPTEAPTSGGPGHEVVDAAALRQAPVGDRRRIKAVPVAADAWTCWISTSSSGSPWSSARPTSTSRSGRGRTCASTGRSARRRSTCSSRPTRRPRPGRCSAAPQHRCGTATRSTRSTPSPASAASG